MGVYEVRVTQEYKGCVEGFLEIKAKSKKDALNKINIMTLEEIDSKVLWDGELVNANQYDINSTQIHKESLDKLEV